MRSPFPGMDPYLEHPALWPDVHNSLLAAIRDELAPLIAPRYFVATERRSYALTAEDLALIGIADVAVGVRPRGPACPPAPGRGLDAAPEAGVAVPDVEVPVIEGLGQNFLEIREVESGTLATVIELLSPANKLHTAGRHDYEAKRNRIFESFTNLVEIDLHRAGRPMPVSGEAPRSDYRILVSPADLRPGATLYAFSVRVPIPIVPIPLLPGDDDVDLDLNSVLHALYDRARFDLRLNYSKPPVPPLGEADAAWARELIAAARPPAGGR